MTERRGMGFGRRGDALGGAPGSSEEERPWPEDVPKLDEETAIALLPKRPARGHKGLPAGPGCPDWPCTRRVISRAARNDPAAARGAAGRGR